MRRHPCFFYRKSSPGRGGRSPPGRPLPRCRPRAVQSHAGNAALPALGCFPPSSLFPLLFRGGDRGGLEATAEQLRSARGTLRGGTSGSCEPRSAARPDRTPPASPRTNPPLQRSATFQSKSGRERGGRGAWRRRKGSFCSKSQEEEIHFLNTLLVAAPFFLIPPPPVLSLRMH